MPRSSGCMSWSSVSKDSVESNSPVQTQSRQKVCDCSDSGEDPVSLSSAAFSEVTRLTFESTNDDISTIAKEEDDVLQIPAASAETQTLSQPEPTETEKGSCPKASQRWGTTPGGEPVVPKETPVFEPRLNQLDKSKSTLSQYCVSIITNTMRYQVQQFSRIVRACQENSHQMSHGLVDDIYVYLDLVLDCERDCIDTLMNVVIPFAEELSSLKGSLKLRERTTLCEWSKKAEVYMRRSQSKFKRNMPAGEQLGYLVHAALGFQFMLDIAYLADRFLPGHMEAASKEMLQTLSRDVFRSMISTPKPGVDSSVRIWAILGWMSRRERRSYRHFVTHVLQRRSLSLVAIRDAKSSAREYKEFPREVEKSLSACADNVRASRHLRTALQSSIRTAFSCAREQEDEETSERSLQASSRAEYYRSGTVRRADTFEGKLSDVPLPSEEDLSRTFYVIESVYELDGWGNKSSR